MSIVYIWYMLGYLTGHTNVVSCLKHLNDDVTLSNHFYLK